MMKARSVLARGVLLVTILIALTLVINFSVFDEPLHPEVLALSTPIPVSMEGNSIPLIYGLAAANDRDARVVGQAIVRELREQYERGEQTALSAEEMDDILGGPGLDDAWQAGYESLSCNTRLALDCADRLIAEIEPTNVDQARLRVLLDRYSTILRQSRFEENQEFDVYAPAPAYGLLMIVGRVRLAISFHSDSTQEFLAKAQDDMDFWRIMLRDGQSLIAKMVALAGLRNDLEFLSAMMRQHDVDDSDIESLRSFVRPLTSKELDIGGAFLGELRMFVLSEKPVVIVAGESSLLTDAMLQERATINEYYMTTIVPMQLRASLTPDEFYRQQGNEPLTYHVRAFPPALYNLGGKLILNRRAAEANWQDYVSRVHDMNGRFSLVLLQTEIEQRPELHIDEILQSSSHRNPYTGGQLKFDGQAQTIGFECLSDPNDVCRVAIGRLDR